MVGRTQVYSSVAERQRAYRQRKAERLVQAQEIAGVVKLNLEVLIDQLNSKIYFAGNGGQKMYLKKDDLDQWLAVLANACDQLKLIDAG